MAEQLDSAVSLLGRYGTMDRGITRVRIVAVLDPVKGVIIHDEHTGNIALREYARIMLDIPKEFIAITEDGETCFDYLGDYDFELEAE